MITSTPEDTEERFKMRLKVITASGNKYRFIVPEKAGIGILHDQTGTILAIFPTVQEARELMLLTAEVCTSASASYPFVRKALKTLEDGLYGLEPKLDEQLTYMAAALMLCKLCLTFGDKLKEPIVKMIDATFYFFRWSNLLTPECIEVTLMAIPTKERKKKPYFTVILEIDYFTSDGTKSNYYCIPEATNIKELHKYDYILCKERVEHVSALS